MKESVNVFWFRRDLRLYDNAGLYHALKAGAPVLPIFIFDRVILDRLEEKADARVQFIRDAIVGMQSELEKKGHSMRVYYGKPPDVFGELLEEYDVKGVYTNSDYEPYARERDEAVGKLLAKAGAELHSFKDQVIFEKGEVLKDDGKPYTVFTPYSKRWKAAMKPFYVKPYPVSKYAKHFLKHGPFIVPSLESMGFKESSVAVPAGRPSKEVIKNYAKNRDFPGIEHGTTRMGMHLRFGTISIRELAGMSETLSEVYLGELIWRDFYHMILWHFPQVGKGHAFKPAYEHIKWRNNEKEFERWCQGQTGYPIVDAGMRELNETGFMHNRVRMIVASFLAKHLLIDWRWGEAYFAEKLLDYDLAANNGGWQWAAGCGNDAAPYFRVFNPTLQTERFDPELKYVRKWVPEYEGFGYPAPIVEHAVGRDRALAAYKKALKDK